MNIQGTSRESARNLTDGRTPASDRSRKPAAKFIQPTAEQVAAYATERGAVGFDADRFIDFYDANGWRVGRNAMRDWRATVRNWIRSGGTSGTAVAGRAGGRGSDPEAERLWQRIVDAAHNYRYAGGNFADAVGQDVAAALRRVGITVAAIDNATDFERRELRKRFEGASSDKGAA